MALLKRTILIPYLLQSSSFVTSTPHLRHASYSRAAASAIFCPLDLLLMIDKPVNALYFCIFILILQQVDGNIIENRILGEKLGISDFWVLVAILVFGGIFGFAGMLLGVPVFAVLYTVIGDRVNKRLARKRHPLQTSLYYTIRTVDDLPPVTEPSYTSAAEEPAYETQIDPDDDMEIDDPDYDDIPG